jgi:hypothetical protein
MFRNSAPAKILLLICLFPCLAMCPPAQGGPSQVGGRQSPDGAEQIQVDLPGSEQLKNIGGKDGAGLCVFTSLEHAGRWQHDEELRGLQQKMHQNDPGGGYPHKVDQMMQKYAPRTTYLQYSGNDPSLLRLCLKTGRMASVTYGYSPRYGSGHISHMVNCVHFTDKWACVLDNNFPGEDRYEWMAPDEFLSRWKSGGGGGWLVVILSGNPPPPIPVNKDYRPVPPGPLMPTPPVPSPGPHPGPCPGPGPCPRPAASLPFLPTMDPEGRPIPWGCDRSAGAGRFRLFEQAAQDGPTEGKDRVQDFGLMRDRIPELEPGESYYRLNGMRIMAADAFALLQGGGGGNLVDDSQKPRITVIGSPEECAPVLADLQNHPRLSAQAASYTIASYPPTHWAVTGVGFPTDGHPTIVVQGPPDATGRGRVVHDQRDYKDGPDKLSEAIRKADPSYDPSKDPDNRKPQSSPRNANDDDGNCGCFSWLGSIFHVLLLPLALLLLLMKHFAADTIAVFSKIGSWALGKFTRAKTDTNAELAQLQAELAALKEKLPKP